MSRNKIVIAGAGVMGASLAQVYAQAGYETVLYDISEPAIEKGRHLVDLNQEVLVKEGVLFSEASQALYSRISYTADKACFRDCDLLLESIVERLDAKQAFWQEASRLAPEDALLATNTSGLSVTELAKSVHSPSVLWGSTGSTRPICCRCAS